MPCLSAKPMRPCVWAPAQVIDPRHHQLKSSYVDYGRLERALAAARADAVWVGWGFVAEHAEFADLCRDMGIVFIGPDGEVMRRLGDKISSKQLAEQAQIPVAPGAAGRWKRWLKLNGHAERLGYPLLIKATAGGGGHGIRRVNADDQLSAGLRERPGRGIQGVWRSHRFHGAVGTRRTPCRSADHRRPLRNDLGRRSARLHAFSAATRRCWRKRHRPGSRGSRTRNCAKRPCA